MPLFKMETGPQKAHRTWPVWMLGSKELTKQLSAWVLRSFQEKLLTPLLASFPYTAPTTNSTDLWTVST